MSDQIELSDFQSHLVLSAFGPGAAILRAAYMQESQPCPIRVEVRSGGEIHAVVLRISRNPGGVIRESAVFRALARLGVPVPDVLAGPMMDTGNPDLYEMGVNSLLPGETLLSLSDRGAKGLALASNLVVVAVRTLHDLTRLAELDPVLSALPRRTLIDDLSAVVRRGGGWLSHPTVAMALIRLWAELKRIDTPLVFSNGDYQPANFLTDGRRLTGLLDFEKAAFVDPLAVLPRFPVYDLWPLSQPDLMEHTLESLGYSTREFAPRVAVFAIRTLQMQAPVVGGTERDLEWRTHVLGVLGQALDLMSR
jgi:aminoglycoside phosphotransferase